MTPDVHDPDLEAVLAAAGTERSDAVLAEALVARGIDLCFELGELDEELSGRALELLLRWLSGTRLTDRADEPERRVRVARDAAARFGDEIPSMHRYHAQAVLALPPDHEERDARWAVQRLWEHLEWARAEPDADEAVRTIAALLDADVPEEEVLDEGEVWAEEADEEGAWAFRIAAESYASGRHIEARDAGDDAEAERWAQRHERYVAADEEGLGALASRAEYLDMNERWDEAADAYRALVEASDLSDPIVQQLALREGELRLQLGQLDRTLEALEAVLPHAEDRYLTTVAEDDVEEARERLDRIVDALAACRARLDDWDGVLRTLDLARGLRARYRESLRADPAGRELLALERELDAATRGAPAGDEQAEGDVPTRAALLERYRQVRPRLAPGGLAGPSVAEVGAALEPGEAVLALGYHFTGMLAVVVAAGDRDWPSGRLLLEEMITRRWLELFVTPDGGQWLLGLSDLGGAVDLEPGMSGMLELVEGVLGTWLREQVDEHDVTRLAIVPEGMLHVIPWPALPSLRGIDVVMAGSVSEVIRARRPAAGPAPREALVVANPTLDLRVSAAACGVVTERLAEAGFALSELSQAGATEPALLDGLRHCSLLHFAGHGRSEPARSGLELHPAVADPADGDPFEGWMAEAAGWRDPHPGREQDGDDEEPPWTERVADVPGLGRLAERRWTAASRMDRRLEHAAGTLVASYAEERLVRLAELWSASDIMLVEGLEGCRLAVLVACSSGAGVGRTSEAQAGLPVALQLAGFDTVVGSFWEVDEGFAALWADCFYAGLAGGGARVDVAALVRRVGEQLRAMTADEACERLLALADRAGDPFAAMELEAYAYRLPDPPFAAPSRWAAFYVTGRPAIELTEGLG
jgi:hypothetical protein